MKDKRILITGATDGIGKQTAIDLIKMGHKVIIHGRNIQKVKAAADEIENIAGLYPEDYFYADLSLLNEVRDMAMAISSKYKIIDVLINNAGIYQNHFEKSNEGIELTFAVNHLSHFLLTLHLLPSIMASTDGRLINVSSMAHSSSIDLEKINSESNFSAYGSYSHSKICNILFTNYLAKLAKEYFTVNALHPGVISTKLLFKGFGMSGESLKKGAETSVYLASSSEVKNTTGKYFVKCKQSHPAPISNDERLQQALWDMSMKLTQKYLPDNLSDFFGVDL